MSATGRHEADAGLSTFGEDVLDDEAYARGLARGWFPVARSAELDKPRSACLLGTHLAVFRAADGRARAVAEHCPHRGARLSMGTVQGGSIQCPYHGWCWDGDTGRCTAIPALGPAGSIPPGACVAVIGVEERYGLVWASLSDRPLDGPPRFPEFESDEWQSFRSCPTWDVGANICASIENFRDVAHLPFVHRATMGDMPHTVEPLHPRRDGFHVHLVRTRAAADRATADPLWTITHREPQDLVYHAIAPSSVGLLLPNAAGGVRMLLFAVAPLSLEASRWFLVAAATRDFPVPVEDLLDIARRITDEDVGILENIRPRGFDGVSRQVHCIADAYTLKYRQAFMSFVRAASLSRD